MRLALILFLLTFPAMAQQEMKPAEPSEKGGPDVVNPGGTPGKSEEVNTATSPGGPVPPTRLLEGQGIGTQIHGPSGGQFDSKDGPEKKP